MKFLFWMIDAFVVSVIGCTPGLDHCDWTCSVGTSPFPARPFRAW